MADWWNNFHPVTSLRSSVMQIHLQLVYCIFNVSQFVFPNVLKGISAKKYAVHLDKLLKN